MTSKELIEIRELINIGNVVVNRFIIPIINKNNIKNTGEFKESIEAKSSNKNEIEIHGVDYSNYAISGRKKGKRPPINQLEKWVQTKFGYSGDQAKQVAFAVAKKIEKEGTDRHHKNLNLIEIFESQEVKNFITSEITKIMNKRLQDNLIQQMKNLIIK